MAEVLRIPRSHGVSWALPSFVAFYAEACAETGRLADGLDALCRILEEVEHTEREVEAELLRLRGVIERRLGRRDEAEASLRHAVAVARTQQARFWELRAANALALLLREGGRGGEAHAMLAPVYASFTEGFEYPDLREAKAVVEHLAADNLGSLARA
jgi:predicted ATPase